MTAETKEQNQTVEEELREVEREIEQMERELVEENTTPLSWDEITSTTADELARKEQRRGILPRLLRAARVKRAELRIRRLEDEIEPLKAERDEAYQKLEKAKAAEQRAKEKREEAHGAWGVLHGSILT